MESEASDWEAVGSFEFRASATKGEQLLSQQSQNLPLTRWFSAGLQVRLRLRFSVRWASPKSNFSCNTVTILVAVPAVAEQSYSLT